MLGKILLAIAGIAAIPLFLWALSEGINKQEKADCFKWQEQAKEYPGFYLTKSEADQCRFWSIEVDAPTR